MEYILELNHERIQHDQYSIIQLEQHSHEH